MRVPSFHDWGWNTLGTFSGAVVHRQLAALGPWIRRTATVLVDDGPVPRLAVAVVGVWAAGQLFPFVPSPDVGNLRAGLRPVWHVLRGSASFEPSRGLGYALAILGLWIILSSALRSEYRRCFFVGVFFFLRSPCQSPGCPPATFARSSRRCRTGVACRCLLARAGTRDEPRLRCHRRCRCARPAPAGRGRSSWSFGLQLDSLSKSLRQRLDGHRRRPRHRVAVSRVRLSRDPRTTESSRAGCGRRHRGRISVGTVVGVASNVRSGAFARYH